MMPSGEGLLKSRKFETDFIEKQMPERGLEGSVGSFPKKKKKRI